MRAFLVVSILTVTLSGCGKSEQDLLTERMEKQRVQYAEMYRVQVEARENAEREEQKWIEQNRTAK